jgi:parallel beta-helix repeat protein
LIVGLIILLLCGVCLISSTSSNASFGPLNSGVESGSVIIVSNTTDPHAIQKGIDAANSGDTVKVAHGTYYENITITNKSINLVGESANTTIIDGGKNTGVEAVVNIHDVNNVNISGFTITNATHYPQYGITVVGADQVNISGNIITTPNLVYGINAVSSNVTIVNNTIKGIDYGIYAVSSNTNITKNEMVDDSYYSVECNNPNADVIRNNISDNDISATSPAEYGLQLLSCNYTDVEDNNVTNVYTGIYVQQGEFENIARNVENTVSSGLMLDDCCESTFVNNTIQGMGSGTFTSGISLSWDKGPPVQGNTFSNNTVENFWHGMNMEGNALDTNQACDMSYNIIVGNTFRSNIIGLYMDNTSSNSVYHNNFFSSSSSGGASYEGNYTDNWSLEYPIGGNYWSDCSASDTQWGENHDKQGNDMFRDTTYVGEGFIDPYPLLKTWPMPGFWYPEGFDLAILTSSSNATTTNNPTITNFGFDKNAGISFNVTDKTSGSCTVIVAKSLLDGAFNISLDNALAACCFDWDDNYTKLSFNYVNDSASHYVQIDAEYVSRSTLDGDFSNKGYVSLPDLVKFGWSYGRIIKILNVSYTGTTLYVKVQVPVGDANVTLSKIYVNGAFNSTASFVPAFLQGGDTSTVTTSVPSDFNPSNALDVKVVCSNGAFAEVVRKAVPGS